jgi:hypothetical protein
VVISNQKAAHGESHSLAQALIAAAVAGSVMLGGCNRSGAGDASKDAATASNQAARLTASAGELRLKPEVADQLKGKDDAEVQQTQDSITSAIKGDKENRQGAWKRYLDQKSVAADLDNAADILKKAEGSSDFTDSALKSSVDAQLGAAQLSAARLHLDDAQSKLLQLAQLATDLDSAALYVNLLGAQAGAQESLAKGDQPADLSKLQSTLDDAKAGVDKAQKVVDDLQGQIKEKQDGASKIYSDTEAAFAASENMKGTAAIDAAKKAAEDRKQADSLSEEAANLQPTLAEAQANLTMAKIHQADAESQLTSATSGNRQGDQRVKDATDQAKVLHDQAKQLLGGDAGLEAKYKAFADLAESIKADISKAGAASNGAVNAYAAASTSYGKYLSELADRGLPDGDPLVSGNTKKNQQHLKAILQLGQSAAKSEVGRTNLIAYTVGLLKATSANAMTQAYAAAGSPKDTGVVSADADAMAAKNDAMSAFESAASLAEAVAGTAGDGSPEKWLGYTLQAIADHGKFLINNSPTDHDDYVAAAKNAQSQNPFLELSGLTQSSNAR